MRNSSAIAVVVLVLVLLPRVMPLASSPSHLPPPELPSPECGLLCVAAALWPKSGGMGGGSLLAGALADGVPGVDSSALDELGDLAALLGESHVLEAEDTTGWSALAALPRGDASTRRTRAQSDGSSDVDDELHDAVLQMLATRQQLASAASVGEHGQETRRRASVCHWLERLRHTRGDERVTRIMFVGDAITVGLAAGALARYPRGAASFRLPLWAHLAKLQRGSDDDGDEKIGNFTFVGPFFKSHLGDTPVSSSSSSTSGSSNDDAPDWTGTAAASSFPRHHAASYTLTFEELHVAGRAVKWVREYQPDIVVLLLGANDLGQHHLRAEMQSRKPQPQQRTMDASVSATSTVARIAAHARSAVAQLLTTSPPSTIVVILTIPATTHPFRDLVPALNFAIEESLLRKPGGRSQRTAGVQGERDILVEDSELLRHAEAAKIAALSRAKRLRLISRLYDQRESYKSTGRAAARTKRPGELMGRVLFADAASTFDPTRHLLDGLLPNREGEMVLAATIGAAVERAIAVHRRALVENLTTLRTFALAADCEDDAAASGRGAASHHDPAAAVCRESDAPCAPADLRGDDAAHLSRDWQLLTSSSFQAQVTGAALTGIVALLLLVVLAMRRRNDRRLRGSSRLQPPSACALSASTAASRVPGTRPHDDDRRGGGSIKKRRQ